VDATAEAEANATHGQKQKHQQQHATAQRLMPGHMFQKCRDDVACGVSAGVAIAKRGIVLTLRTRRESRGVFSLCKGLSAKILREDLSQHTCRMVSSAKAHPNSDGPDWLVASPLASCIGS